MASVTRSTVLLTLSGMVEFALQFLVPMIFVRSLDPAAFGEYRLLWLMASTALALAPAFMPQALFYFLPRASAEQQRVHIGNVLAYLTVAGAVVAFVTSPGNPYLPASAGALFADSGGMSALFLGCWMVVSIMTVMPVAEGRIGWQACNNLALSLLRTVLLACAAIFTHSLFWVVAALMAEAAARIAAIGLYLATRPGKGRVAVDLSALFGQLRYALPFAVGNALFLLRFQADQWIVAGRLSPAVFGVFSISAVFLPVAALLRQPVSNALMPRLNKAFAEGHAGEIQRLFHKSASVTTLALVALGGVLLCVTKELVEVVYTARYADAVPIMRIYLVSMMLQGCAAGYVLPALNRGRAAILNNAFCLAVSITASYFGVRYWGLQGAACGSVLTFVISELWSLLVVARVLGVGVPELLPWQALARAGFAALAALALVALAAPMIGGGALSVLVLKASMFLVAFVGVYLAAGGMSQLVQLYGAAPLPVFLRGRHKGKAS
jgi:O-antigen/teichoic acid export membrane protein